MIMSLNLHYHVFFSQKGHTTNNLVFTLNYEKLFLIGNL